MTTFTPTLLLRFVQRGRYAGYWMRVPFSNLANMDDMRIALRDRGYIVRLVE